MAASDIDQELSQVLYSNEDEITQPIQSWTSTTPSTEISIDELDCNELSKLVKKEISAEVASTFKKNKITGKVFLMLTKNDINEMVIPIGERVAVIETSNKVS